MWVEVSFSLYVCEKTLNPYEVIYEEPKPKNVVENFDILLWAWWYYIIECTTYDIFLKTTIYIRILMFDNTGCITSGDRVSRINENKNK